MADGAKADPGAALGPVPEVLRRNANGLIALGVVLMLAGAAALAAPFVASLAVGLWIGLGFLCAGLAQAAQAWRAEGWRGRILHVASGVVYVLGGLLIAFKPLAGLVVLSTLVVATLLVSGVMRLVAGLTLRPETGWGWITAGGAAAIGAALLIWASFPGATLILLGVLAGVAFLMEGWGVATLGFAARRAR